MTQEFLPISLINKKGQVTNCRYYPAIGSKYAVILVGGIGGDFDSPAKNLYPKLASKLSSQGVSGLRVQFRYPTDLQESIADVIVAARFLESKGVEALGLVGHSFGGAVVIQAGVSLGAVKTVVTLATQGFGTDIVDRLAPRASIFLIHGSKDETLSSSNSRFVFEIAQEPKRLLILDGNGHGLVESASEVLDIVYNWMVEQLKGKK